MENAKTCSTCRHKKDNTGRCMGCQRANPSYDARAYDDLWEAKDKEWEFEPGEDVLFHGEIWKVLGVCNSEGECMLEVIRIETDPGNSGEFTIERKLVPSICCAKRVHELTAEEYAAKMREYFGDNEGLNRGICGEKGCIGCAFFDEMYDCCRGDQVWESPERALEMIRAQEEAEKEAQEQKPKRKTYLEDFCEKLPGASLNVDGTPRFCRDWLYKKGVSEKDCSIGRGCEACWNEEMPEDVV